MHRPKVVFFCAALFIHLACSKGSAELPRVPGAAKTVPPEQTVSAAASSLREISLAETGLQPDDMDQSADPCGDFFQYACGGWLARTKIPEDRARYGRFIEVSEKVETNLREILEGAANATSSDSAQLGAFYGACMDEKAVERAGLSALEPLRERIRRARTRTEIEAALTALHRHGIWAGFHLSATPDFADASTVIAFIGQSGLGLGDREYYLRRDAHSRELRDHYRAHVNKMMALLGYSAAEAKSSAGDVLRLETEIARASKSRAELRDPRSIYNRVDRAGLARLAPRFDWRAYFTALGRPQLQAISAETPELMKKLDHLLTSESAAAWRHYLDWQLVHAVAAALPQRFVEENFALTHLLSGVEKNLPRWKRCVVATEESLGELLAQEFVARRLQPAAKQAAQNLFRAISGAFERRLAEISWMSPETRSQAGAKLSAMKQLVGYPDRWRSYDFAVTRDNYAANELAAAAFEVAREVGKLEKPFDRSEWEMSPTVVNAYYTALANQLVFPAAILQPPFFSPKALDAVNAGALGMVVGHELTHGFDDEGAQFDGLGNLRRWWTKADQSEFEGRGQCVRKQYAGYQPLDGVKLDGKLTLGENIADLGGVKLAYAAYRQLRDKAPQRYTAGGLSEDKLFFLAFGQAWCSKDRDEEMRRRAIVDPHSPPRFRVNGVLSNLPEFRATFSCPAGTAMAPAKTCEVW
jgi:putative endopeptidase